MPSTDHTPETWIYWLSYAAANGFGNMTLTCPGELNTGDRIAAAQAGAGNLVGMPISILNWRLIQGPTTYAIDDDELCPTCRQVAPTGGEQPTNH